MAQKKNFQFSIRDYRPSDQHAVTSLLRAGIREHVCPAFFKAMSHPDHVGVALSVSMAGYVLGGSSYFQAVLFGSAWAALTYYCCQEIYDGYAKGRLAADMADIPANYLENPGNGFWVAEAEVNGRPKVAGVMAVTGKEGGAQGGPEFGDDAAHGSYGEMSHVVVAFPWRRKNLGSQLTEKALDFCKERGYARLVLDVSSPQKEAVAMYQKLGFVQTASHSDTHANRWFSKLARISVMRMEKVI
ncbi:putative N-acetyltransferase 8B [Spinachia spinachia]